MRHPTFWSIFGFVVAVCSTVLANPPWREGAFGIIEQATLQGLVAGPAISGDKCLFDNNMVQCGYPTTDVAPSTSTLLAHSAAPLGSTNKTGANLQLNGGWPTMSGTAVQANCGASDNVTLTTYIDGVATTKTCTRHATTDDATNFTCGASNAALATNIAACLATATGVATCANTACSAFTGVSGSYYVYPATDEPATFATALTSSGDHSVVTLGTNGSIAANSSLILSGVGTSTLPSLRFTGTSSNTGINLVTTDTIRIIGDGGAVVDFAPALTTFRQVVTLNNNALQAVGGFNIYSLSTIAADATTFDPDGYMLWTTVANVGATALTDFTTPTAGAIVILCGGSDTNATTIADSGNFNLSAAMTLNVDDCIGILVQADNDYIELWRVNN